jgi:UDP-glucuronate 4-epimerase
MPRSALVTGAAGFVGSHLVDRLLRDGWHVTGVDNFDDVYPVELKRANVAEQLNNPAYTLVEADVRDGDALLARLTRRYDAIVHLAAKSGVRPSIANAVVYQDVNVRGTLNLLEFARTRQIQQFVFASSGNVYGVNPNVPWCEDDYPLRPISPSASTKASGELLGHVYSHLHGIRFIALRLFTAYGPRQRPDMAIRKFAQLILDGDRVPFYGDGSTRRDYTYIDDIIDGIVAAVHYDASSYEVFNLASGHPVSLGELVRELEDVLGLPAWLGPLPDQVGDLPQTWGSVAKARELLGYQPSVRLRVGLERFASWLAALLSAEGRPTSSATATSPRGLCTNSAAEGLRLLCAPSKHSCQRETSSVLPRVASVVASPRHLWSTRNTFRRDRHSQYRVLQELADRCVLWNGKQMTASGDLTDH